MESNNNIFLGSELKLNVSIAPIGTLTMDDYNWVIEVWTSAKRVVTIEKKDSKKVDENNYIILVDTADIGTGDLKCKVNAQIPDGDFADNYRTEIVVIDTGIKIVKSI